MDKAVVTIPGRNFRGGQKAPRGLGHLLMVILVILVVVVSVGVYIADTDRR
jgi:hypothetical protein